MNESSILMHYGEERSKHKGAVVPPIYQNSLFVFNEWEDIDSAFNDPANHNIYSRERNEGVAIVEDKIAKVCNGEKAKMFSSGMGAITAAILHYVKANDHIVTINNVYGPANNFIKHYLRDKSNIDSTFVSGDSLKEFEEAIQQNTTLIYLESPSSAIFTLQDIEAVTKLAQKKDIKVVIDNTWATPIFQKPLNMGVDLEIHSCSKYIGGHSDVVAGVVVGREQDIKEISQTESALLGAKMAPFEAWLILRSLRTLPIRMKEHEKNTSHVVQFLNSSKFVENIHYPGMSTFKQYTLARQQMTGFSGLFSIDLKTDDIEKIKSFINSLKYFQLGVSWGGHESLVYVPAISYQKELTEEQFEALNISYKTIRFSIGLEDSEDLIEDLSNALMELSE